MKYRYRARGRDGAELSGVREAQGEEELVRWLRSQDAMPIRIQVDPGERGVPRPPGPAKEGAKAPRTGWFAPRVRLKDKAILFRQMATMIDAGITILNALEVLVQQTQNRALAAALGRVRDRIQAGVPLSAAMGREASIFSPLMIALIRAGEEGGVLDVSLTRLAAFLEKQDALRRKVISAVSYPAVVVLFAIVVLYILVTFVVPKFATVFEGLGIQLPALTLFLFRFAALFKRFWYVPLLFLVLLWGLVQVAKRFRGSKRWVDRWKLRLPLVGGLVFKAILARSFRTFGTLVEAGVPLLNCLDMTGEVAENQIVRESFDTLRENAKKGIALNISSRQSKLFPAMVSNMVAIGEETGRLESMLAKIADWYESELEETIKQLTSILEPVLIIFVGGIVAIVALAIFMPIISAIQALS